MNRPVLLVLSAVLLGVACSDDDGHANDNNVNQNGNQNAPDICGNDLLEGSEECDDGTANSDTVPDACRAECVLPACGDGVTDPGHGEECDEGATNSDTEPDTCRADCALPRCGDGVIDTGYGEICDEGAANSEAPGAACRTDCRPGRCGDGVQDPGEGCDQGIYNDDEAPNACRTDCRPARCGDDTLDSGEVCDDGNNADDDGCSADCLSEEECGNGILDPGEACDAGDYNSRDPNAPCRPRCVLPGCGDGVVDDLSGEVCDDATQNSNTTPDACRTSCRPAHCGDGVRDAGELCDDNDDQDGDGCSSSCTIEYGWDCTHPSGLPSQCTRCDPYQHGAGCALCAVLVDLDTPAGTGDGTSWATAFATVQEGIDQAAALGGNCEVWVAAGVYHVYAGQPEDTIALRDGVSVYGGFAGDELAREERDWLQNVTILDGSDGSLSHFVLHVVSAFPAPGGLLAAVLDGFTVRRGRTQVVGAPANADGGGLHAGAGADVVVRHGVFEENHSARYGGGVYTEDASVLVEDCTFRNNHAYRGAGLYLAGGTTRVIRSSISGNTASDVGGGVHGVDADVAVSDTWLIGNAADTGGGMASTGTGGPTIQSSTFYLNEAGDGGGLYVEGATATLSSVYFYANTATSGGGMRVVDVTDGLVDYCLFAANGALSGGGIRASNATFTASNTEFRENDAHSGGGAYLGDGAPTITGCQFIDNDGSSGGGGMIIGGGTPTVTGCLFQGNTSDYGGGLSLAGAAGTVSTCQFIENSAEGNGGGVFASGATTTTLAGCTFTGNVANLSGGYGGGMCVADGGTSPLIDACRFVQNHAALGAGLALEFGGSATVQSALFAMNQATASGGAVHANSGGPSAGEIINCTLWNNLAGQLGGGVRLVSPTSLQIHNAIIWENFANGGDWGLSGSNFTVTYSDVQEITPGANGNINDSPLLDTVTFQLGDGSPCIDAANGSAAPEFDLEGNARVDTPPTGGSGVGPPWADMGALEHIP